MAFATRSIRIIKGLYVYFLVLSFADPEIFELTSADVTQTTVPLSWSIGNTQHIDLIQVHWTQTDSSAESTAENTTSNSSHTLTSLTPGTTYQFYVTVKSYRLTARTNTITVTTGATTLARFVFEKTVMVCNSMFSQTYTDFCSVLAPVTQRLLVSLTEIIFPQIFSITVILFSSDRFHLFLTSVTRLVEFYSSRLV